METLTVTYSEFAQVSAKLRAENRRVFGWAVGKRGTYVLNVQSPHPLKQPELITSYESSIKRN